MRVPTTASTHSRKSENTPFVEARTFLDTNERSALYMLCFGPLYKPTSSRAVEGLFARTDMTYSSTGENVKSGVSIDIE